MLIESVVTVLKPQLCAGTKRVATAYGEVMLRAWKLCSFSAANSEQQVSSSVPNNNGKAALLLEDSLQVFVREAIYAANVKYSKSLRSLLGCFSGTRRTADMDSMLMRVYGPIIWRGLRCANALVREQATFVFFDAFPLQETNASVENCDTILQKQFDLFFALLKDEDHRVRSAAVSGVSVMLRDYWDAVPAETTHAILRYLVETLGFDSSSSNVRLAVFSGLNTLFQQPLAHSLLQKLLPLLKSAIHDNCEKVRVMFVRILIQVLGLLFVGMLPGRCFPLLEITALFFIFAFMLNSFLKMACVCCR